MVVGNGNVADGRRADARLTREELAATDVADHALEVLRASKVREIVVLGRRGPAQAAFTNPELLELGELTDADVIVDPGDCELDPLSQAFIESETARRDRPQERQDPAPSTRQRSRRASAARSSCASWSRRWRSSASERVEGIQIVRNELHADDDGAVRPKPGPTTEEIQCGLVFRSIGYRGVAARGACPSTRAGRDPERRRAARRRRPAPRRVRGGLDQARADGHHRHQQARRSGDRGRSSSRTLDAGRLPSPSDPDRGSLEPLLAERQPDAVTYAGWQAIDQSEKSAGEPHGRPRVKLCSFEDLLEASKDPTPAR